MTWIAITNFHIAISVSGNFYVVNGNLNAVNGNLGPISGNLGTMKKK